MSKNILQTLPEKYTKKFNPTIDKNGSTLWDIYVPKKYIKEVAIKNGKFYVLKISIGKKITKDIFLPEDALFKTSSGKGYEGKINLNKAFPSIVKSKSHSKAKDWAFLFSPSKKPRSNNAK